ncbi:MAG: L-seryl-tRNA(Sec) selenium transferase, partial [Vicinamibacteria bacterium]
MEPTEDLRRRIPQISRLLDRPAVKAAAEQRGRALVERVMQTEVADLRALATHSDTAAFDRALESIESRIVARADQASALSLRRVINATGVVVHTNLGRAPLSPQIAAHVAEIAASYTNLEFDLEAGSRGDR